MSAFQLFRQVPVAAACALAALSFTAGAAPLPAAKPATAPQGAVVKVVMKTAIVDGRMVFVDAQGRVNPTLEARAGDTVEIDIASGEGALHDIAFPDLKVASARVSGGTAASRLRFKVGQAGEYVYICTVAGHRQVGMEGVLKVAAAAGAPQAAVPALVPVAARTKAAPAAPAAAPVAALPAASDAVSVVQDPNAVPAPVGARGPTTVKTRIESVELNGKLADGTTFNYWTFDKKVPGPMLRVRQGDTVELTFANAANSKNIHSIDLHAVTGPGGGAEFLQVAPGKEKTVSFKALNAGVYVYHCATASVPEHISAGMYGLIVVEPAGGLPKVDREFYVMQGDLYTHGKTGAKGHQPFDHDKLAAELPEYYVFNGAVGALTKEFRLQAKVGETVRIYFGVGGPNKISSFHVIGEIFDRVYAEGSPTAIKTDVQTTLVAPGGATIVEFKVDYPGKYVLVDHALSRVGKGLAGFLDVTGPADASVYRNHGASDPAAQAAADGHGH